MLFNQGFEKNTVNGLHKKNGNATDDQSIQLELEDIQSDDESSTRSKIYTYFLLSMITI